MEQYSIVIPGTASYCGLNTNQHSSAATESNYEISGILGDLSDIRSDILPEKQYRVVAGRMYVVRPDSPPNAPS